MGVATMATGMWRAVSNNIGLKIISLTVAVAAFYLVQGEQDAQRSVFIDVVALMPPPDSDVMLVSSMPDQVKVTLRGSRSRINSLSREDFEPVQMTLTDTSRRYYYFDPSAIDVPLGVTIVQIEPATVALLWAQVAERKVPIRVRTAGQPREGVQVRQPITVVPARVTVHGPATEVQAISEVETEVVVLDGLEAGQHTRRIPLERQVGHVSYLEDFEVQVRLDVAVEIAERTLSRLDVAALGNGEFALRPIAVDVLVRGPAHALAGIETEHVVPYVDLQGFDSAGAHLPFRVGVRGLPETVSVVRVSPPEVLVRRRR